MAVERLSLLEVLEDSYSAYHNIMKEDLPSEYPLIFKADFLQRGEHYWLSKKMTVWGNETNEFVYLFSEPGFDLAEVERCVQFSLDDGLPRVHPHKEHQYTNIKAVFVADDFTDDALSFLKKQNFTKTYNHSMWGYTNLVTCAANCYTEKVVVNACGPDVKKFFKKLFAAQHKKR